jgi:hypothetical protein
MSGVFFLRGIKKACAILVVCVSFVGHAFASDVVATYKDENGWKLQVNGNDFYVKGVVWGYAPRNENFSYDLWGKPDDFVRKVLDYEFSLLKEAGVNAFRSFNFMPPKWVTYVYREYGIMVAINPLVGRYGTFVNGKYVEFTDYSDPLTRASLIKETLEIIEQYKDVPGVLMFALGNESNYGLSWKSFEIENLPVGEQNTAKALYLYSLFNEIMAAGKKIAPNHPFTIVNGDLQYIDLIAELCPELDLLGVNAYRGKSFTGLWAEVDEKLDLPVLFFEFGSDAYNSRTGQEDQLNQALIIKEQWREMYHKSYGNGEEGNSIGGFQFEWRDEWWKYLQDERLDIHDTNASWANGGYPHDYVEGRNNMNEEWWGIASLGTQNSDGIYEAIPRMAYDVLTEVWKIDPYTYKKVAINQSFDDLNMDYLELKSDVRALKNESGEKRKALFLTGGSISVEGALKGTENDIDELGDAGDEFTDGQMAFIDFGFAPTERIDGQFTVNVLGNVTNLQPMEFQYGDRGQPLTVVTIENLPEIEGDDEIVFQRDLDDRERIEIYDFSGTYRGDNVDIEAFYHTPRYHWKYEGDFYGLILEATDIQGSDIWNAKAPFGVEFAGKGAFEGLKVVGGPEVYWGANPKFVVKYQSQFNKLLPFLGDSLFGDTEYAVMYSEDVARQGTGAQATQATIRENRQATLYTKTSFTDDLSLELGGIIASTDRIDEEYTRVEGDNVILDKIDKKDTLGFRAKLNFPLFGAAAYLATDYAGLVAEGGARLREWGTLLNYGDGLGNRKEYEGGVRMAFGQWTVFPRVLWRENLVDANPLIRPEINRIDPNTGQCTPTAPPDAPACLFPGANPRNRDDDPFAVLDNREARAAEVFLTYDPTGATYFYQWDNDMREDARFAFNVGANYTEYPTFTDSYQFFFEPTGVNGNFGVGLPEEDTWEIASRIVLNPSVNTRVIARINRGFLQSTGDPTGGTRKFWKFEAKLVYANKHIIDGYFKKDAWGAYDFQRQFNVTFPEQFKLEYTRLLDQRNDPEKSSQINVRFLYRTNDEEQETVFLEEGSYRYQIVFNYTLNFGGGTNRPRRIN